MINTITTPVIIIVLTPTTDISFVAMKIIEITAIIVIIIVMTTTIIILPVADPKITIVVHHFPNEITIVAQIIRRILIVEPSNLPVMKRPRQILTNQQIQPTSKSTLLFRINFLKLSNCHHKSIININRQSIHQCLSPCHCPILNLSNNQFLRCLSTLFPRQLSNLSQFMDHPP